MLATDIETGFDKRRFLAKIALEGEGPAALCRIQYASGRGRSVSVSGRARSERTERSRNDCSQQIQISESRALVARFFIDLRRALG